jgi:hypothetical protein
MEQSKYTEEELTQAIQDSIDASDKLFKDAAEAQKKGKFVDKWPFIQAHLNTLISYMAVNAFKNAAKLPVKVIDKTIEAFDNAKKSNKGPPAMAMTFVQRMVCPVFVKTGEVWDLDEEKLLEQLKQQYEDNIYSKRHQLSEEYKDCVIPDFDTSHKTEEGQMAWAIAVKYFRLMGKIFYLS